MRGSYGYTPFTLDATAAVRKSLDSVSAPLLAVRLNSTGSTSRWYSGAGLLRPVTMTLSPAALYVPIDGIGITTSAVSMPSRGDASAARVAKYLHRLGECTLHPCEQGNKDECFSSALACCATYPTAAGTCERLAATLKINVSLARAPTLSGASSATITVAIYGPNATTGSAGKPVATMRVSGVAVPSGAAVFRVVELTVATPSLWSPHSPSLYTAHVEVAPASASAEASVHNITFGIRTLEFDHDRGMLLNGVATKLRGGCLHHSNGPLGGAAVEAAEVRKVRLLKRAGYNALRTTHNPPSVSLLRACDELGIMVMEEAFDCWTTGKNPDDYHLYFDAWWRRDLTAMVMRDRNHPSVVIWSIGNEIPERYDTRGVELAISLTQLVHALDRGSNRPVTSAVPVPGGHPPDAFGATLDVLGYNYACGFTGTAGCDLFERDRARLANVTRLFVSTESVPRQSAELWTTIERSPYILGDFTWAAMSYLGESALGATGYSPDPDACNDAGWPYHTSSAGDFDIVGAARAQHYFRRVLFNASALEMAVHSPPPSGSTPGVPETIAPWGWPDERQSWSWAGHEGELLTVRVFCRCAAVTLSLNGKLLTHSPQPVNQSNLTAVFIVPYAPGSLEAIGVRHTYEMTRVVGRVTLKTAGSPVALQVTAESQSLHAKRGALAVVWAEVVDAAGLLVPHAQVWVHFSLSALSGGEGGGAAEIAAVGNGDPLDPSSFRGSVRRTHSGQCVAIVRPGTATTAPSPGRIKVTAKAKGLAVGSVELEIGLPERE